MRSHLDAKHMAKALRATLKRQNIETTHGQCLEIVAAQFGVDNWNSLSAKIGGPSKRAAFSFVETAPIFRIFDEAKAKEFYLDFLGFSLDWEHRFGENFPIYASVSRAGMVLHLSAHHGDASPGSNAFVRMNGVRDYQRELAAKDYTYMKPGIEEEAWGLVMEVTDPFSNHIRFCEQPEE